MSRLLALFRARTPDHRGTLRDLMPHRYLNCTPQAQSPLPLRIRNRVFMTLNRTPRGKLQSPSVHPQFNRLNITILGIGILFYFNGILGMRNFGAATRIPATTGWMLISAALTAIPVALVAVTLVHYGIRSNAKRIANAIAAEGYCPTCAYPLAEIETAADGCTVCPECGGAWRVSSSDRETEPASNASTPPTP